jgi:OmpA-OmpF porin, OOP family
MIHSRVKLLTGVLATLLSSSVLADNHKFEVQAGVGRDFFEEMRDDTSVVNFGVTGVINKNWSIEAMATSFDTLDTNIGNAFGDIDGKQYRLDALYNIDTTSLWRPFIAFGAGEQTLEFNNGNPDERDTLVDVGVGLKRSLGGNWEFRSDLRAFHDVDNYSTDLGVNAGVSYLFGATPAPAPVVVAAPAPVVVKEVDTDGDGVFDSKDKCPDTPKQYKVDAVGCPMELTEKVSIKLAVKFDTDKAVVKDQYVDDIGNLAKFMNQYANTVVTVEGHTDSQGSDAYNKSLSQKRADAVKAVLIAKFGIAADRVTALGMGEEKPVADNANAAGREENRRVVGAVSSAVKKFEAR